MRTSQLLMPTQKETPAEAELISHQLMLRAGLIRKLASGLYVWLPLGLRVLKRVEQIVREEMNRIGAQEILMPMVQPAELWQESGRWDQYGKELLRLKDRHERPFCLGPTHEEVVTDIARREIRSYKQLPATVYQIQTKFRDEIRPRFGIMRAREFIMKDAYSFHLNEASLKETYQQMMMAYSAIFSRLGLKFRAVLADTGSIGGHFSHEFHVLAESGEDVIAYSNESDYAANLERAEALDPVNNPYPNIERKGPGDEKNRAHLPMEKFATPNMRTIRDLDVHMQIPPQNGVKTLIVCGSQTPLVALILRGDHELHTIKAEKLPQVKTPLTFADEESIRTALGCGPGSIGPVNLPIPFIVDRAAAVLTNFVCGANCDDFHYRNVNWGQDVKLAEIADLRFVVEGDLSPDGHGQLQFARGIEVGHVFQLGDKYSEALGATVLDEQGQTIIMKMGCYGIGVSRIVAASIEQNNDDKGIIWPNSIAPFQIALIPINMQRSKRIQIAAEALYMQLQQAGFSVLFDDRLERPGTLFADMDLIGIPHRLVLSEKNLDQNTVEYKHRRANEPQVLQSSELLSFLQQALT